MSGRAHCALWLALILSAGGCAGRGPDAVWGPRWPGGQELARSAVDAARSPATWLPLAGAAALAVTDTDDDVSEWASDHRPLFGSDAESDSDDLRTAAKAAWVVTALAAPSPTLVEKAGGLAVGAVALYVEDTLTQAIKDASGRTRPDDSDDESFSSGHAGTASAATTLARRNLDYLHLPRWLDGSLRVGLHGLALSTGWARVEAEKHYVADVLAGYAVGHFVAAFVQAAFMEPAPVSVQVQFQPLGRGGALTLVVRRF